MSRRRALAATLGAAAGALVSPSWAAAAPRLRRGLNFHHTLNWPDVTEHDGRVDYAWPPFAGHAFAGDMAGVKSIVALGFDFIRLTVDPSILIAVGPERRPELMRVVLDRVRTLIAAGLAVVVDLHPVEVNPAYAPDAIVAPGNTDLFATYADAVARLAAALAPLPADRVALELMNEPRILQTRDLPRWQPMLALLHARARDATPNLPLVLSGAQWSSLGALTRIDPAAFRGSTVLYTFHYYDPHTFTHQGVGGDLTGTVVGLRWPPDRDNIGPVLARAVATIRADRSLTAAAQDTAVADTCKLLDDYVGTPSGPVVVTAAFRGVERWAADHGIDRSRMILGEFGGGWNAATAGAKSDTLAWLRTVRSAAEASGFAWAYWAYGAPMQPDLLDALGMRTA